MAVFNSDVASLTNATPRSVPNGAAFGGKLRRYRAVINLATVNGGSAVTTNDQIVLGEIPAGSLFAFGVLTVSATLGSSTVAIGTGATHAANGQYRAAAVFTSANTPTMFGLAAAVDDSAGLTANTLTYLTVATADLPTSGTVVVDLYFSQV